MEPSPLDHSRERRRSRADRRVFERRRKHDRRSGGFARPSHTTVESAREHIRNAIQIFKRIGTEQAPAEWSADADAAISRLTRALADLDAGRI